MGIQNLYLQIALKPEAVHRLLTFITEVSLALGQWEEVGTAPVHSQQ